MDVDFLLQQRKRSRSGESKSNMFASVAVASQNVLFSKPSTDENRVLSNIEKESWHQEFFGLIASCNLPFSTIRSNRQTWERFISYINGSDARLKNNLPTFDKLSILLGQFSRSVDDALSSKISAEDISAVNLAVDGWKSVSKSHILGVVVTRRDTKWSSSKVIQHVDDTGLNNAKLIEQIFGEIETQFQVKIGKSGD